jgi:hypothetical protein
MRRREASYEQALALVRKAMQGPKLNVEEALWGDTPRALVSVMHEARRYTLEAIGVLAQLMQSAKSESVRLNAAEAILSRGWGRAVQAFQIDSHFAAKKLNELTSNELSQFEARLASADPQPSQALRTTCSEALRPWRIGNQDCRGVPMPGAVLLGGLREPLDLSLGQIFAAAPANCYIY